MAKKSAVSKGFRKQTGKKPYLSKRDIILLCVLIAALAVASILLFRYDDGALKVQDGKVTTDGDNWLIVNGSNTRGGARYFKLGEVGALEGYDRATEAVLSDENLPDYVFTAQAEDAPIQKITVSTSHASAEAMAKYAASMLSTVETAEVGEVQSADIGSATAHYFLYTASPETPAEAESSEENSADEAFPSGEGAEPSEADEVESNQPSDPAAKAFPSGEGAERSEADEVESNQPSDPATPSQPYGKTLSGYVDAAHDSCVTFRVESAADTPDALPDDDALLSALESALAAVTLEPIR